MTLTTEEIQKLLPPNTDYPYFARAHEHPFQPAANGFQLVNAAWLMETALLAYVQDTNFISRQLAQVNLHNELMFLGFDNQQRSTQCFVAHNDEVIIAAFRGTEVSGLNRIRSIVTDILTDAQIVQVSTGFGGGVHQGFAKALEEVWGQLSSFIGGIRKQQAVWFTGHSLGGALATLAADRFARTNGNVQGLYSFGSPRVGDERFQKNFGPQAFRIVHGRDIVTAVPISGPVAKPFSILPRFYKHVGELKFIDHAGKISDDDPRAMSEIMSAFRALTENGLAQELAQPLIDHAPVTYARLLWQNL